MDLKVKILIPIVFIAVLLILILVPISFSYLDYYDVTNSSSTSLLSTLYFSLFISNSMHLNDKVRREKLIQMLFTSLVDT